MVVSTLGPGQVQAINCCVKLQFFLLVFRLFIIIIIIIIIIIAIIIIIF